MLLYELIITEEERHELKELIHDYSKFSWNIGYINGIEDGNKKEYKSSLEWNEEKKQETLKKIYNILFSK